MEKEKLTPVIEALRELKKETEVLEKREAEKFNVGLLLKNSIDSLRVCIPAFQQPNMRDDTREKRLNFLKGIGLNLVEVCRILGVGSHSPVIPPEFVVVGKKGRVKKAQKQPVKVSRQRKKRL